MNDLRLFQGVFLKHISICGIIFVGSGCTICYLWCRISSGTPNYNVTTIEHIPYIPKISPWSHGAPWMVWRIHSIPMALFSRRMRTLQGTLMHDVFITVPVAGRMASRRIDATFAAWLGPSHTASHTVLVGQPEKTTQFLLLKLPSFIFVGSPQFLGVQHDGRVNSPRC